MSTHVRSSVYLRPNACKLDPNHNLYSLIICQIAVSVEMARFDNIWLHAEIREYYMSCDMLFPTM